jgi:thymidylate kinase
MFENLKNTTIITIEGKDGSGKTTVAKILAEKLNAELISFPKYNSLAGSRIKQILTKQIPFPGELEFQSLQLADKIEAYRILNNYTKIPETIVNCRYYESSYVYAKANEGVPLQYLVNINSVLPQSTLSFVLSGKNYGKNSDFYETDPMQKKVSYLYLSYAKKFKWNIINNEQPIESVVNEIISKIHAYNN